jgi:hypothetical protein
MSADNEAYIFQEPGTYNYKIAICHLSGLPDGELSVQDVLKYGSVWEETFPDSESAWEYLNKAIEDGFFLEYGAYEIKKEKENGK